MIKYKNSSPFFVRQALNAEAVWKEVMKSWEFNGRRVPVARPHSLLRALHAPQESPPHRSFSGEYENSTSYYLEVGIPSSIRKFFLCPFRMQNLTKASTSLDSAHQEELIARPS